MAGRKVYTKEDAYNNFISVLTRSKFDKFIINNNILICKKDNKSYVFKLEDKLYSLFIKDENYKDKLKEFNNDNEDDLKLIVLVNKIYNDWIKINGDDLYNGKITSIIILINNDKINVELNKGIFPCRLLKKEFKDIYYNVILNNSPSLIIKKEFKDKLEGFGFNLYQVFQII